MNIFVGNLSYQTSDSELQNLFSEFGNVTSAKIITDNYTSRSRGFGFVEMPEQAEAQAAIEKLNGMSFMQQTIVVNEARPRTSTYGGGGGNRSGGGGGFQRDNNFKKRY